MNFRLAILLMVGLMMVLTKSTYGSVDTLYTCHPGDAVPLQVTTTFAGYSWFPAATLDNPTVANPTAFPQQNTLYIASSITASGENLIKNGDFSSGNIDFSSQYIYSPGANPTQGVYGVFSSSRDLSPQVFRDCRDHTNGMGKLMVVDGSPIPNQQVWCQTVAVKPNTTYAFSTWVTTVLSSNPARLQFSINNEPLGIPFSPTLTTCFWLQFYETWFSNANTEAEICVINQNTNPTGNDFALDDFSFFELGEVLRDSFWVVVENIGLSVIDTAVCSGTFVEYAGELVPAATSKTFQFTSTHGCDSIVVLNVGVLDTLFEYFQVDTLCPGETFDFFGHTIWQDTVLCETISQGSTCDTIVCLTAVFLTAAAIGIDVTTPSCNGQADGQLLVAINAGLPPYRYEWEDGSHQFFREGLISGSYNLQVKDAKDCSVNVPILLGEPPPLSLAAEGHSQFCNDKVEGQIVLAATGGTEPYQYRTEGTSFQAINRLSGLSPGAYAVWVIDDNGCLNSTVVDIPAPYSPTLVVVAESDYIDLGDSTRVRGLSDAIGPLTYQWFPEVGVSCSSCPETDIRAFQTTQYTLVATDTLGCELSAKWLVQVNKQAQIYIPNAFSPNDDGVNDTFVIYTGNGVQSIHDFSVFDRWGNQLFYKEEYLPNDPSFGWDGTFFNEVLKEGLYVFMLRVTLVNGLVEQRSGEVLLIR